MSETICSVETVGDAIVQILQLRGVNCLFGGAPTSMIEALANPDNVNENSIRGIVTPHEQTSVAMAHGYYAATGRPQAVYLYSTVGTANGLNGIINASRAHIPMIVIAARSPIAEQRGIAGARDIHVQWSQESFDQASMLREYVKWDYEIRQPDQVVSVMERAFEVATAEPCGPVYISVPRDVLAAPLQSIAVDTPSRRITKTRVIADPEMLDAAADLLASAKHPIIITSEAGRTEGGRNALAELSETGGFGVLEASPVYSNLAPEHPCHLGYIFASQVSPDLEKADVILVVDSDVPWFTARVNIPKSTRVIQLGIDPFYQQLPMRGFPCDVPLIGHTEYSLNELTSRLKTRINNETRKERISSHQMRRNHQSNQLKDAIAKDEKLTAITPLWANHCISQLISSESIIVNEYPADLRILQPQGSNSYFGPSHAGGLGWGLAAALGIKVAKPDSEIICTLGDGAYYYCAPTSCHEVAAAENLPLLIIVFNNGGWNEVKKSVISTHPGGHAARANSVPLTSFGYRADFEKIVTAFGGYGAKVEKADELQSVLHEAMRVVREEKRQALVNIITQV
ncbi:thiamine pyrophosphate-requiring protein [Paenochrobactrum sp. BZR 201-1]